MEWIACCVACNQEFVLVYPDGKKLIGEAISCPECGNFHFTLLRGASTDFPRMN